jgi:hypothetical protein
MQRNVGPWSLQEALTLVQLVIKATNGRILKKSRSLVFRVNDKNPEKKQEKGVITVYEADKVQIEEVLPLLIKAKRTMKHFS